MILLDANVLMYAAGAEHPNKVPSLALLERVAAGTVDAGADVEVLQEVLHRYRAIGRWHDGRRVFDLARKIVPTWYPVDLSTLDRARDLLEAHTTLTARGALHAAVYFAVAAEALCTFDRDFDRIAGLRRVEPGEIV